MLRAAQRLEPEIRKVVTQCVEKHKGYSVVLCGHSLGAGIATLLACLWGENFYDGTKVRCFSFAPPCVLSLNLSILTKGWINSIVNNTDMVPRFGLNSMLNMR